MGELLIVARFVFPLSCSQFILFYSSYRHMQPKHNHPDIHGPTPPKSIYASLWCCLSLCTWIFSIGLILVKIVA